MTPPNHNTPSQWGKGSRQINTRLEFAAVVRDISGIDTWYPVRYGYGEVTITKFKIAEEWQGDIEKYGYWWEVSGTNGFSDQQDNVSDIWTAKTDFCKEILGCTQKEINDIFWGGKDRSEVGCQECPCNRVEKGGVRQ
jgi:hypothetical protein